MRPTKRDRRLHDLRLVAKHTLGLATMSPVGKLEGLSDSREAGQRRMNERLDEFERRVAKVEQKLGI